METNRFNNKQNFLILMEEQSYLTQSFKDAFDTQSLNAQIVTLSTAKTLADTSQPSGYLICTSPEFLKKMFNLKSIIEKAAENRTPIFIMRNTDELQSLSDIIPPHLVTETFIRPINVGEMAESIATKLKNLHKKQKHVILAVDDSGVILRKIKTLLEDTYQVALANSAGMAIKYLTLHIPDLILLDYEMPIVDGSQFMQMLREDPEFKNIPIIFLTGKNDINSVKNAMALKPDGYLLKTMEADKLHMAIDNFFAHRE